MANRGEIAIRARSSRTDPSCSEHAPPRTRCSQILSQLGHVTVDRPNGPRPPVVESEKKLPAGVDLEQPVPDGSAQLLRES